MGQFPADKTGPARPAQPGRSRALVDRVRADSQAAGVLRGRFCRTSL